MQTITFLLLKNFKNGESAQLCTDLHGSDVRRGEGGEAVHAAVGGRRGGHRPLSLSVQNGKWKDFFKAYVRKKFLTRIMRSSSNIVAMFNFEFVFSHKNIYSL